MWQPERSRSGGVLNLTPRLPVTLSDDHRRVASR